MNINSAISLFSGVIFSWQAGSGRYSGWTAAAIRSNPGRADTRSSGPEAGMDRSEPLEGVQRPAVFYGGNRHFYGR